MFHPPTALPRAPVVALLALLPALARAQTLINFDALPACASTCTAFVEAQNGCVPPRAGTATQQTYVSCFCESALLTNFRAGSGADCASVCPNSADQSTIQQWYANYCASGGQNGGVSSSATSSSATAATATTSSADSTSTRSANSVINDYDGDGDPSNNYEGSWISAHWKWVVMLAVIFIAMIAFSVLGVWLKRRHRARRDAQRSNLAATESGHGAANGSSHDMTGAIPAPPPMAYLKGANDSGTLASTLDLPSAAGGANGGRVTPRGRSGTMTRFPNGSMSNVGGGSGQGQPVVWGPHQHQAATRGYEYHDGQGNVVGGGASPGPSLSPSPSPGLAPIGSSGGGGGSKDGPKVRGKDVAIEEVADEGEHVAGGAPQPAPTAKERLRRKLSKR